MAFSGGYLANLGFLIVAIIIGVPSNLAAAIAVWRDAKTRGRRAWAWAVFVWWGALLAIPMYLSEVKNAILPPIPVYVPPSTPQNPDGLRCPTCQGQDLIVGKDQSAYCLTCRRGILPTAFRRPTT
jgi:hypothetical protein